ncbi:MAG: CDP-alcohol phosphatidyltransferase family protein [Pseudomonadota bacterium]
MLDARLRPLIDPALNAQGARLARLGLTANQVTFAGLALGLTAAGLVAGGAAGWAILPLLLGRLADGLDGAIARATQPTALGGYLDILADFTVYAAIPLAFVWYDPAANGAAGAFLLATFYINAAGFLGYAVLAERRDLETNAQGEKSIYFANSLLEGTETIVFLVVICAFPAWFSPLAWLFGGACLLTAVLRYGEARRRFGQAPRR